MNILEFSDELLCMICTYIEDGEDKIAVSKTCSRFQNLMQDRELLRKNNFSRAYHLSIVDIGNFILTGRNYVVELNLTSCCFLTSSGILSLALKLSNLKHFYVADTKFQLQHLFCFLEKNREITKLSLTWKEGRDPKKEIDFSKCPGLAKIENLFVYVKPGDRHADLSRLVRPCTALRELRIIALTCVHTKDYFPQAPKHLRSLAVSCRFCCYYASMEVAEEVKILAEHATEWDYFIFDFRGSDVFAIKPGWPSQYVPNTLLKNLDNMKHARAVCFPDNVAKISQKTVPCKNLRLASANLFNVSDDSSLLDDGYPMLQQLRIFSETQLKLCHGLLLPQLKEVRAIRENPVSHCPDFSYIKYWPDLTKLCVSSCVLKPSSCTERNIFTVCNLRQPFKPKQRRVAQTNCGSLLRDFVNSSPHLQELDIRGCNICIGRSPINTDSHEPFQADSILKPIQADGELMYVAYWHNLERLDLSKVPIRTGAFLFEVSQSCPKLHSLYLSSLGLTGMCTYTANLVKALPNCKNLKDFRLYQNSIGDVATIFTALKHCSKLERLSIICPSNPDHKLKKETVINFVWQAKKLRFLFLCFDYDTLGVNEGSDLQRALNRIRDSRKSLVTEIHSYCSSDPTSAIDSEENLTLYVLNNFRYFDNIPGFHLAEMVFHHYTVSSIPLFWETYNVFR